MSVSDAIQAVGGPVAAAKVCNVSRQAVDKWVAADRFPRTEYTGETDYAQRLANAAAAKGNPFDPAKLLANTAPKKAVA